MFTQKQKGKKYIFTKILIYVVDIACQFLFCAECNPLCVGRCKLHSRKQVCLRACMTCCDRCKCVPPGTYGNREKCGKCYTDMTTTGGRPKCPWSSTRRSKPLFHRLNNVISLTQICVWKENKLFSIDMNGKVFFALCLITLHFHGKFSFWL